MPNPLEGWRAKLGALPLWAQVLVAQRVVQRALLGARDADAAGKGGAEAASSLDDRLHAALQTIEQCCWAGEVSRAAERALRSAMALRERGDAASRTLREAVYWAIDACRAAQAAQDFPVDALVTHSAANALLALAQDDRFGAIRVLAVAATEIDLIGFAAGEARQPTYGAVPAEVRGRMLPLHAL